MTRYEDTLEHKIRCLPIFGTNKLLLTDVTDTIREHGQAAKADSRAMQDALEQVCEASAVLLDLNDNYAPFGGEIYRDAVDRSWDVLRTALSLAAPFRKTGV